MSKGARSVPWLALAFLLLLSVAQTRAERQDSRSPDTPAASQENSQASQPQPGDAQRAPQTAPPVSQTPSTPSAVPASDESKEQGKIGPGETTYALTSSYSATLPRDWVAASENQIPPPAPLSPYAPFHLSGNLALSNMSRGAILQFATSNNPLIGHDSYWLDTQMHAPSDSGMSLLNLFFYYFFPPSEACMHQVLTTYAPASRVSPMEGPAYMQVYYSCPLSDSLSDYYAAQVSAGITFQRTDNGTRVLAPVGDFYLAPMEQVEESGMTFFVFEAQGMNAVSSDAARRFHLPENAPGGQPDFFWAIGAASPFPFVADDSRKDVAILHVAYARLGVDADAKEEFMNILRQIRAH
jgi:hypothetical protein